MHREGFRSSGALLQATQAGEGAVGPPRARRRGGRPGRRTRPASSARAQPGTPPCGATRPGSNIPTAFIAGPFGVTPGTSSGTAARARKGDGTTRHGGACSPPGFAVPGGARPGPGAAPVGRGDAGHPREDARQHPGDGRPGRPPWWYVIREQYHLPVLDPVRSGHRGFPGGFRRGIHPLRRPPARPIDDVDALRAAAASVSPMSCGPGSNRLDGPV